MTSAYLHPPLTNSSPVIISPHLAHDAHEEDFEGAQFGTFIEHMVDGVYGGLVEDEGHPAREDLLLQQPDGGPAVRRDVLDLIKRDGDLGHTIARWPGGNFASNYHWQDGVGPISDRPVRVDLAWSHTESNRFGTDEYIAYCRLAGFEPYICLNMGTGTLEEALAWVEYCNGTSKSTWANLRRKHTGRKEPHAVKYWSLGNEVYGPYQIGHSSAQEYALKARAWAHALKAVDPSIKLVACGLFGATDWDEEVIRTLLRSTDYLSIHHYSSFGHSFGKGKVENWYETHVFSPAAVEKHISLSVALIDRIKLAGRIPTEMDDIGALFAVDPKCVNRNFRLCLDEWNVWDETSGHSRLAVQQRYKYVHVLALCAWLNILVRQRRHVAIACMAQCVNVLSPLISTPQGVLRQATFFPFALFSKFMKKGRVLPVGFTGDKYNGPTYPQFVASMDPPPYVDMAALLVTESRRRSIRLSVVNRHPEDEFRSRCVFVDFDTSEVEVHSIYHDDLNAENTFHEPDNIVAVFRTVKRDEWDGYLVVPKHSWSLYVLWE